MGPPPISFYLGLKVDRDMYVERREQSNSINRAYIKRLLYYKFFLEPLSRSANMGGENQGSIASAHNLAPLSQSKSS